MIRFLSSIGQLTASSFQRLSYPASEYPPAYRHILLHFPIVRLCHRCLARQNPTGKRLAAHCALRCLLSTARGGPYRTGRRTPPAIHGSQAPYRTTDFRRHSAHHLGPLPKTRRRRSVGLIHQQRLRFPSNRHWRHARRSIHLFLNSNLRRPLRLFRYRAWLRKFLRHRLAQQLQFPILRDFHTGLLETMAHLSH